MIEVVGPVLARLRATGLAALGRFDEALDQIDSGLTQARQQGLLYDQGLLLELRCDTVRARGATPDPDDVAEAEQLLDRLGVRREPIALAGLS